MWDFLEFPLSKNSRAPFGALLFLRKKERTRIARPFFFGFC
jgi:hypothetical protein